MGKRYLQRVNPIRLAFMAIAVFIGLMAHALGCGNVMAVEPAPEPTMVASSQGHSPCEPDDHHTTVCIAAQSAVVVSRPGPPASQFHAFPERGDVVPIDSTQTRIRAKSLPGHPVATSRLSCVWLT